MAPPPQRRSLLREAEDAHTVSYLELFFDLVYVFAITQISHFVLSHGGWLGFAEAVVIFFAVWWAWMYTTWASNWVDPDRVQVRVMLLLVMLGSLLMAVAVPHAFSESGLLFALAYVAIQIGRSTFIVLAMRAGGHPGGRTMARIVAYFGLSGALWVGGALAGEGTARLAWWAGALAIEYAGPLVGFWLPGRGAVSTGEWVISGGHMAERCALFIIIALGEGIVVTGATFAGQPLTWLHAAAFLAAFLGSVMLWWIYFDLGARRGSDLIEHHQDAGRVARDAYTYLHIPIVMGIIGGAVGDEMLLAGPEAAAQLPLIAAACGGATLYLLGTGLFKRLSSPLGNFPMSHLVGLVLFAALAAWGWFVHPETLAFGWAAVGILTLVAIWEWGSYHGGWRERLGIA